MGRHASSFTTLFVGSNSQSTVPISSADETEYVETRLRDQDDENLSVKEVITELDEDEDTKWDAVSYDVCSWDEDHKPLNATVELVKDKKLSEEVDNEFSEHSPYKSEVAVENELSLCPEFEMLNLHLQNTRPTSNNILQKIFEKHGDITKGSILKSTEAKAVLLHLVVEAVEVLKAHNMDSIGAHQMEIIQTWTDDAAAVGFDVEWLQKRNSAIFKYQEQLTRYNEIGEQINAAKQALQEMEAQQMVLKKEVDLMKGGLDQDDFCGSNFCDGLI